MPLSPDDRVIEGFGQEWSRFRNDQLAVDEIQEMFDLYTSVFPWDQLPECAEGFDAGCGSVFSFADVFFAHFAIP